MSNKRRLRVGPYEYLLLEDGQVSYREQQLPLAGARAYVESERMDGRSVQTTLVVDAANGAELVHTVGAGSDTEGAGRTWEDACRLAAAAINTEATAARYEAAARP